MHAHCDVPLASVKGTPFEKQGVGDMKDLEERVPLMDKQGVDVQALSINGFWWYEVKDQGLARAICNRAERGAGEVGTRASGSFRRHGIGAAAVS